MVRPVARPVSEELVNKSIGLKKDLLENRGPVRQVFQRMDEEEDLEDLEEEVSGKGTGNDIECDEAGMV